MLFSKKNPPSDYYVYAYLREDGSPYYIGKGKGDRAWSKGHTIRLPIIENHIVIVSHGLTELWAYALERRLIKWYGRKDLGTGILRNRAEGGEGFSFEDMSRMWSDSSFRNMVQENAKKLWLDPDFVKMQKELQKRRLAKLWSDPEYVQIQSERMTNRNKIWWQNPDYVKDMTDRGKKLWENEEYAFKCNKAKYDNTIYHFKNDDSREEHCTKYSLYTRYSLSPSKVTAIVKGRRKSHKGWRVINSG